MRSFASKPLLGKKFVSIMRRSSSQLRMIVKNSFFQRIIFYLVQLVANKLLFCTR